MAEQTPVLQIRNLRVERDRTILDAIDWTIERGQHWAILGPNGSGKTSLLKVCCGYLTVSAGTVLDAAELTGRAGEAPLRERVGLVSHSLQARIEPGQTVAEVVHSGRRALLNDWTAITPEDTSRLRRILRAVRLESAAGQPWAQLSQGERQRALLGRALWSRVPLLFLDEPCAGLDPVARESFLAQLEGLGRRARGPAIVLITHHVEEIVPAITHVLLLRAGRVVAQGPKEAVLTNPQLRATFGDGVTLRRSTGGRFRLHVRAEEGTRWF